MDPFSNIGARRSSPGTRVGNGEVVGENIQMTKGEFVEIVYPKGKQDVREYDCGVEKSDPTQQYQ